MENRTNSLLPKDYYQTILEIKQRINDARFKSFRAVNTEMILMYLEIGKVISLKVSKGWGDSVVDKLSIDLQAEYPGVKGFSSRNLRRMKQIHEQCGENEIWPQLVAKLPWGHTGLIFSKCKKEDEMAVYRHGVGVISEISLIKRVENNNKLYTYIASYLKDTKIKKIVYDKQSKDLEHYLNMINNKHKHYFVSNHFLFRIIKYILSNYKSHSRILHKIIN